MPKRTGEREEDYLKRKIRRFKQKLDKLSSNCTNAAVDVAESQDAEVNVETEDLGHLENSQPMENSPPTENNETLEDDLPEEFLLALGSEGEEKENRGPEIRSELASRWTKLMSTGLEKDALEAILKKYPIPANFSAEAPKMNPEILASLSELTIKRDKRLIHRQNLTGKAMCALGRTLTNILKGDINSKVIIEQVNDAAKLCAEIYYEDSSSRKYFALSGANQTVKDAVRDSKPDVFLFGSDCAENIKAAQAIKKTGSQIKVTESAPQTTTRPKSAKRQPPVRKQENWRGPSQHFHQRARGGHRPLPSRRYEHQQHQSRDLKRSHRPRQTYRR